MSAARTLPRPSLLELSIAGPIDPWLELGFSSDARTNTIRIGTTKLRFENKTAPAAITSWMLDTDPGEVDGLKAAGAIATSTADEIVHRHANGALVIDHLVVMTPDIDRTDEALAAAGFDRKRVRQAGTIERPLWQSFYRVGEVVLEVVGPKPGRGSGGASFWGVVVVVDDLTDMASAYPDQIRSIKDAVQPGRQIATVDKSANLGIPVAFMNRGRR